jgi:hypothetical protein
MGDSSILKTRGISRLSEEGAQSSRSPHLSEGNDDGDAAVAVEIEQ